MGAKSNELVNWRERTGRYRPRGWKRGSRGRYATRGTRLPPVIIWLLASSGPLYIVASSLFDIPQDTFIRRFVAKPLIVLSLGYGASWLAKRTETAGRWRWGAKAAWTLVAVAAAWALLGPFAGRTDVTLSIDVQQPRLGQPVTLSARVSPTPWGWTRVVWENERSRGFLNPSGLDATYTPRQVGTHVLRVTVWAYPWFEKSADSLEVTTS